MGNHMSNPSLRGKKLRYAELQGIGVSIIGKIGKREEKSSNFALGNSSEGLTDRSNLVGTAGR